MINLHNSLHRQPKPLGGKVFILSDLNFDSRPGSEHVLVRLQSVFNLNLSGDRRWLKIKQLRFQSESLLSRWVLFKDNLVWAFQINAQLLLRLGAFHTECDFIHKPINRFQTGSFFMLWVYGALWEAHCLKQWLLLLIVVVVGIFAWLLSYFDDCLTRGSPAWPIVLLRLLRAERRRED
jgi:hypothetical protein